MNTFIILSGGDILDYNSINIPYGSFIIAADSGCRHALALGITPDLIVGDFDSADLSPFPESIPRITLDLHKNHTDTTHAINLALERGARSILIAGALGGRLDHSFANMQDLARLSRQGIQAMLTDGCTDIYAVTNGEIAIAPKQNCYLSVFSMTTASEGVNIADAVYTLQDYRLAFDHPRAVSNEFLDIPAHINVKNGTLCIMVIPKGL